jgi:hypothetical protein
MQTLWHWVSFIETSSGAPTNAGPQFNENSRQFVRYDISSYRFLYPKRIQIFLNNFLYKNLQFISCYYIIIIIIIIIIKYLIKEVAIFNCKKTNNNITKITWVTQDISVVYLLDTPGVFYLPT